MASSPFPSYLSIFLTATKQTERERELRQESSFSDYIYIVDCHSGKRTKGFAGISMLLLPFLPRSHTYSQFHQAPTPRAVDEFLIRRERPEITSRPSAAESESRIIC